MSRYTSAARCHNCGHEEGEHCGKVPHYEEITACKVCDCEGFTSGALAVVGCKLCGRVNPLGGFTKDGLCATCDEAWPRLRDLTWDEINGEEDDS